MLHRIATKAGANQRTPSVPQYFSWINNTNEGSTEAQTLTNLEFFAWLKELYGMEIRIYAWDAGNFDGAGKGYGDADGEKFRAQYPNGYAPIAEKAKKIGIRMGLWGGPDGFGDTAESEKKRHDFLVDLCRKHNFALFKFDSVCGKLRAEKAPVLAKTLRDCRKYSPDLIVLNHRLRLHEAAPHATTFLWQGKETYVDVHSANDEPCMHHRGFIFKRGMPEDLERLAEDHGVCISSSVAYFEDDLIYQAFGRCMILAPEIYGNPWLLRDDEFPKLARIYNLHKTCAKILVNGIALPDAYGCSPVSRGTSAHRFITTGNHAWTTRKITISLNEEIGIKKTNKKIALIQRHPSEKLLGLYDYGERVEVELMPFRAHLFEVATQSKALPVLENCEYEMIREDKNGYPLEVKMLFCDGGEITLLHRGKRHPYGHFEKRDAREKAPRYLGKLSAKAEFGNAEQLFEVAQFAANNDSLERREEKRAGKTAFPQVKAARDAFFAQPHYLARGCDSAAAFDGKPDTFFDGCSKYKTDFKKNLQRCDGGCLRVDFGEIYDADEIEITCFAVHEPIREVPEQAYTPHGTYSTDLASWQETDAVKTTVVCNSHVAPVVKADVDIFFTVTGDLVKASYPLCGGSIRYFRLDEPMDRIYAIRLLKNGQEIALQAPKANNLQPPYSKKTPVVLHAATVQLPTVQDGDYIAVALNGVHGAESAFCVAEIDGKLIGFPDRAPAYHSNMWEFPVCTSDQNYTYYLPLSADMSGKELCVRALLCDSEHTNLSCDVWLCPKH